MRLRWPIALALVAGCASTSSSTRPTGPVECGGFVESRWIIAAREPIKRCYIQTYNPDVWGRMSSSAWLLSRIFASTYPNTVAPLSIVNGFISSMTNEEASVLAKVEGITVYECGRSNGISDLDVIAYVQSEAQKSERKVPQPEAMRLPRYTEGPISVAVCSALSKIRLANIEHDVEWQP
jgi:hypothetical protein